jgi:hypothetical protein
MRWQSDALAIGSIGLSPAVLLGIVDLVDLVVIALRILTESYSRSSTTSDCLLLVRLIKNLLDRRSIMEPFRFQPTNSNEPGGRTLTHNRYED